MAGSWHLCESLHWSTPITVLIGMSPPRLAPGHCNQHVSCSYGLSMVGTKRLDNIRTLLEDVLRRNVPGSFVGARAAAPGMRRSPCAGGSASCI